MSRRNGKRNTFKLNKNYLIPLVCIIVTCATLITCTIIVINTKNEVNELVKENSIGQYAQDNVNTTTITDEQKVQINKLLSFLISNLETSKDLNDENNRYLLVNKYYFKDNTSLVIPNDIVNLVDPEIYRNLGYVYFDDYKEEYKYIKQEDFKKTYEKLFNIEKYDINNFSKYYIPQLDGFVVPKNNDINESIQYKVNQAQIIQDSIYNLKLSMVEINMYTLYEIMNIEQINEYLDSANINQDSLTGNILSINVTKQNDIYVFDGYGSI